MRKTLISSLVLAMMTLLIVVTLVQASPPQGVTPTVIARGTYPAFQVMGNPDGDAGKLKVEAKTPIDMVVRRHEYAAHGSTGWHRHPYPVFVTVISGSVTFYERDDPTCTPHVVHAGQGYVDDGQGHIGLNETDEPAVDVSVIMAPVGATFRSELDAPSPYCDF